MIKKILLYFKNKAWKYENICKVNGHKNIWIYGEGFDSELYECHDCGHNDIYCNSKHYYEFHKKENEDNYGNR